MTAVLVAAMAACGSDSDGGSSGSGGLPATVKLLSIQPVTGAVAHVAESTTKGQEMAVEEINEQKFLGDTRLEIEVKDSGYSATNAASLASQGIASKQYAAILGPPAAQEAVALAPIAQKAKMPTLFVQSSSAGVLVGDYIFRVTAPQQSFYANVIGPYLQSKNVKKLAVLFSAGSPTPTEIATKILPEMAGKYGFTITDTKSVSLTTTDLTAPIAALLDTKPDAFAAIVIGANNPGAMIQLRQYGFTGPVIMNQSAEGKTLVPAGDAAKGAVWATDFNPYATDEATQRFVEKYKAKYGSLPNLWHAESYDAVWMAARALKEADSTDAAKVQAALDSVAAAGFDGALGTLKFEDRDLRLPGMLVEFDGKEPRAVPTK